MESDSEARTTSDPSELNSEILSLGSVLEADYADYNDSTTSSSEHKIQKTLSASFSAAEKVSHQQADERTRITLSNAVDSDSYRDAVARLITANSLSHRLVESPEWIAMCLTLNWCARPALIKSHTTVAARIAYNFLQQRELVKEPLKDALSCIHLCTDTWYAGLNFQKEFQAISAQFVHRNGELPQALLSLPELPYGHSGAAVAEVFYDVISEYNLQTSIGWINGDNHGANNTLCASIEEFLRDCSNSDWHANEKRLRCVNHVINMPVQTFLFAKDNEAIEVAEQRITNTSQSLDDALADLANNDDTAGWCKQPAINKLYRLAVALRNVRLSRAFKATADRQL